MNEYRLPPEAHAGQVRLQVRDLDRVLQFYRDGLGLRQLKSEGPAVFLAAAPEGPYLFILSERPDASPPRRRATGLFHVAVRYPDRRALARALAHLVEVRYPVGGAADHLVSEALYLADPEGNGIELYVDRPRETWPVVQGQVGMATDPLDVEGLMAEATRDGEPWTGADPRTDIGHVHLQVSDLARAEAFYHGLLGLDVTQRSYPGALFFSAGGYHHHVGTNIWNSRGASAPPPSAAGLLSWSLVLPDAGAWEELVARLQAAGFKPEVMAYPADEGLASVLVRDEDGIGVELLAPRTGIDRGHA